MPRPRSIPYDNRVEYPDPLADALRKQHKELHYGKCYEGFNGTRTLNTAEKGGDVIHDVPFWTWVADPVLQSPTKTQYYGEYTWSRQPVIQRAPPWERKGRFG